MKCPKAQAFVWIVAPLGPDEQEISGRRGHVSTEAEVHEAALGVRLGAPQFDAMLALPLRAFALDVDVHGLPTGGRLFTAAPDWT